MTWAQCNAMEKQLATQQREVAALKQSMMDGANGVEKQWKGTGKGARKGTGKASGGAKAKGNGKGGAGKGWGKSDGGKGAESGEWLCPIVGCEMHDQGKPNRATRTECFGCGGSRCSQPWVQVGSTGLSWGAAKKQKQREARELAKENGGDPKLRRSSKRPGRRPES